jgi:hypothetical protein
VLQSNICIDIFQTFIFTELENFIFSVLKTTASILIFTELLHSYFEVIYKNKTIILTHFSCASYSIVSCSSLAVYILTMYIFMHIFHFTIMIIIKDILCKFGFVYS